MRESAQSSLLCSPPALRDDKRVDESTLPAGGVAWILELGVAAGGDPATLLAASDIRAETLATPDARIPRKSSLRLWRAVVRLIDDPSFPARFGQSVRPDSLGVLGYLMRHSKTLGDFIATLEAFQQLTQSEATISVWRSSAGLCVGQRLFAEEVALRFPPQFVISSFTAMIRAGLGDSWSPVEAFFQHGPVPWAPALRRVFRCPLRFDASCSGITVDPADEGLEFDGHDHHLRNYLRQQAIASLESMPRRPPWSSAVMRKLAHADPAELPELEAMARALGMSGRTLQRRLRGEGRRYSELVEGVRIGCAKQLLADRSRSVSEIADMLGYAGVDGLSRAFRRWTGQAPSAWRRQVVDLSSDAKAVSRAAKH